MLPPAHHLIYIIGPTATGKTALGIAMAQRLGGEIVNADSRQVYRYLDIGAAKPTPEEQNQAVHHLLDLLPPDENFSLGMFLSLARTTIADLQERRQLPILVGGTGQYAWALYEGWNVPEIAPDLALRRQLEAEAAEKGAAELHRRLQSIDLARAGQLDPRNVRRVIRALEIHHLTGQLPSDTGRKDADGRPGLVIGLTMERSRLYQRIDRRFDRMMEQGFLEEAQRIAGMGYRLGQGPLACPGYRELGQHLAGEISLDEAVERAKFQTHRLARRQYTWFKLSDPRIRWLDAESPDLLQQALALAQS